MEAIQHRADHHSEPGYSPVLTRMGFSLDVVGYSRRPAPNQIAVQDRLATLVPMIVEDLGQSLDEIDVQPNGDGIYVFLPAGIESHRALPALLTGIACRLSIDNTQFDDRIRMRMSVVFGPVGRAALGFGGSTIIACGRLVDSSVLREAVIRHPESDLVALVSDQLYRYVVGEGYPGFEANQFERRRVRVKEFDEPAWLWIAPNQRLGNLSLTMRSVSPGPH